MRKFQMLCCTVLLVVGIQSASAFALLGPYAPWMLPIPGYRTNFTYTLPNVGGPMNIGQGYRWNVPTITYAYDQSFLNFFGTNGIAAVEAAIKILNDLPPASAINLTNYPLDTTSYNSSATNTLVDLKSCALYFLLGQMGLASPVASLFCLTSNFDLSLPDQSLNLRNFDPGTLNPSVIINGAYYEYDGAQNAHRFPDDILTQDFINELSSIVVNGIDPTVPEFTSIADGIVMSGQGSYYTGLTMDDVGGLKYLLNTNNIALESLLTGVTGAGANTSNFVNRALRPGVDKITLVRLLFDPITGQPFPYTSQYIDVYQTNGVFQQQTLQRVITQPDIVFSVKYLTDSNLFYPAEVSSANGWINNGTAGQDGPGVIQPPAKITFNAFGQGLIDSGFGPYGDTSSWWSWCSFGDSTNTPFVYPAVTGANPQTTLHLWLNFYPSAPTEIKTWNLSGASSTLFHLQTSTNLTTWSNVMTITNIGNDATFMDAATQPRYVQRFYRLVGQ